MKKIISLILAILGIGLLVSCVGKIDLDKPISNDNTHTTIDNQTIIDDSNEFHDYSYKHEIQLLESRYSTSKFIDYKVCVRFDFYSNIETNVESLDELKALFDEELNLKQLSSITINLDDNSNKYDYYNNVSSDIYSLSYDGENISINFDGFSYQIVDKTLGNTGDDYYLSIIDEVRDSNNDIVEQDAISFDSQSTYKHTLIINYLYYGNSRLMGRIVLDVYCNSDTVINNRNDLILAIADYEDDNSVTCSGYMYDFDSSHTVRNINIGNNQDVLIVLCYENKSNYASYRQFLLGKPGQYSNSCIILSIIDNVSLS